MVKIVNSFSGGESSAYQAVLMQNIYGDGIVNVFANTGNERPETLDFVQRFSTEHSLDVVWVEAVVHPHGEGTTHRIVNHNSASRCQEPFIEVVKKYGIANQAYPHCTRELKAQPIRSYLRELYGSDYVVAIGIRKDEPNRHPDILNDMFMYPLWENGIRKVDVNVYFEKQPFRLNLHEHEGNCKDCWKKSDLKHAAIWQENPEYYNFPAMLEREYPLNGYNEDGTPRKVFRNNRTTQELIEDIRRMKPFVDAYRKRRDLALCGDDYGGCGESCEPFQAEMFSGYGW